MITSSSRRENREKSSGNELFSVSLQKHSTQLIMESNKIVHLHLKEPYNEKQDFYFGSLKAIYDCIPEDVVGVKYTSLKSRKCADVYENRKCVIKIDVIQRKKQVK
jgi:hypothetical protein